MKKKMKKKSFSFVLVLFLMTALLPMTPSAQATSGQTGNNIVEVRETVTRESTVYAGEIFVDGQSAMKYLYSTDLSNHSQVFKNLQDALAGTAFDGLVPTITGESETRGLAVSSAHAENMNADWTSAAAVAKLFYTGTPGAETNGNLYDLNAAYRGYIDSRYQEITEHYNTPHSFDKRLDSALNTTTDFVWVQHDGDLVKEYTVTASIELTTVFYTSVNVTTAPTNYTVTYKVVNGTWSDGSTADRTETVTSGASPASVPTGMKASSGYTGGAWDKDPTAATITEATTFTYTFDAESSAVVTEKPKAKSDLIYTGAAQELVTAGTAEGGEMQYAIGTDATTAPTTGWSTSIPTCTDVGIYYVWYKVAGDENHNDSEAASVTVTITKAAQAAPAAPTAESVTENSVTLKKTDRYQYSMDGTTWQNSNVFSGLSQNTEYTFYQRIAGDENHEPSPAGQGTAITTSSIFYTVTESKNTEHTIGSGDDAVYTVKRNVNDADETFKNFTGATVDGSAIPDGGSTAKSGSLVLTLKSSYLDTLSVGDHKMKISFVDGTVEVPLKIKAATPTPSPTPAPTPSPTPHPVPQTGDNDNPVLWVGLILLGIAGLAVPGVMKASRKRR